MTLLYAIVAISIVWGNVVKPALYKYECVTKDDVQTCDWVRK